MIAVKIYNISYIKCSPASAARKGGRVQPAVMVHEASIPRAGELSNFTTGEWVSISTGHGTGNVGGAADGCKNI